MEVILRRGGFVQNHVPFGDQEFYWRLVDEILNEGGNCIKPCYGKIFPENNVCKIELHTDCLIIRSLKTKILYERLGITDVEIIPNSDVTHYTILDQLEEMELYTRIKKFYENILANCWGKTNIEKEEYIFGERGLHEGINFDGDNIEKSADYILKLPQEPNSEFLIDLTDNIISKKLEYAFSAKDEYCVEMNIYAQALKEKLKQS